MSTFGYESPGGTARGGERGEAPGPYSGPRPAPGSPPVPGPHGTQQTDPTAVLGRRIVAWAVDALLFTLLMLLFSFLGPLGSYAPIPEGMTGSEACEIVRDQEGVNACTPLDEGMLGLLPPEDRAYWVSDIVAVLGLVAGVAWFVLVYVVIQGTTGATPGKWLLKVRVVGEDGLPPGLGRAAGRSFLWIADAAPYVVPLVGLIAGMMSTGHRRVGDMVAHTYVVGLNDVGVPVQVPGEAPPRPALQYESPVQGMPAAGPAPGPAPGPPGHPAPPQPTPPPEQAALQPSAFVPAPSPTQEPTSLPPFDPAADAPASPPSSTKQEPSASSNPFATLSSWPERPGPGPAPTPEAAQPPPAARESSQDGMAEPTGGREEADRPEEPAQPVIPVEPTRPPIQPEPATPSAQAESQGQPQQESESADEPVYQPQWDADREAYIQWDPDRESWLQWDDAAQQWHRI